jgi:ubiquinone/menaquinone biosynthesis C-methylase UbiE
VTAGITRAAPAKKGHRWFASYYDRIMARSERSDLGRWRAELLAGLSGDVVEIGAGTGANFAHYPPGAHAVALEPDPYMASRAEARRPANVEVKIAPAERLPLDAASFDAAVVTLVLCTVDDPRASLTELRRVLRPGGEMRFIEHVAPSGALGIVTRIVQPVYGWIAAGCQLSRHTEQAIRDAGLTIERLDHAKLNGLPVIKGVARAPA